MLSSSGKLTRMLIALKSLSPAQPSPQAPSWRLHPVPLPGCPTCGHPQQKSGSPLQNLLPYALHPSGAIAVLPFTHAVPSPFSPSPMRYHRRSPLRPCGTIAVLPFAHSVPSLFSPSPMRYHRCSPLHSFGTIAVLPVIQSGVLEGNCSLSCTLTVFSN